MARIPIKISIVLSYKRRWKKILCLFLIGLLMTIIIVYLIKPLKRTEIEEISTRLQSFLSEDEYSKIGFLLDSSNCKIPAFSEVDPSILPLILNIPNHPNCDADPRKRWTYTTNNGAILLNESAIKESGYELSNIICCYRSISRDERLKNVDGLGKISPVVDSRVVYSKECIPMQNVTIPFHEFVLVTCRPKYFYWYFGDKPIASMLLYRNYHAIVPQTPSNEMQSKINRWSKIKKKSLPPHVLILGFDSVSRLNFRRSMNKTIEFLEKHRATEMLGYTKVGENTWPNIIPMLTGYGSDDFVRACYYSRQTKLDNCPFVWKRYHNASYLTADAEDAPRLTHWNFEKLGFLNPPTDFYLRPYMVGVHMDAGGFYPETIDCIGGQTPEQTVWKYLENIMKFSKIHNTPTFSYSWLTQLAHANMNSLRFADDTFVSFLNSIEDSLDNTIVFVVADHGPRYGNFRQTLIGYYEDKLPVLWIYLPKSIKEKYPDWLINLRRNSRRLISAYDIYQSLHSILDSYDNSTSETVAKARDGKLIHRKYGSSLFTTEIPQDRTCNDAGIPPNFCACDLPINLPLEDTRLQKAADATIKYLNSILPEECAQLNFKKMKGGALLKYSESKQELLVEFYTNPGDFLFESTVNFLPNSGNYVIENNVQRLNQFQRNVNCILDQRIQLYCYCN